jgi:hypothetical protein
MAGAISAAGIPVAPATCGSIAGLRACAARNSAEFSASRQFASDYSEHRVQLQVQFVTSLSCLLQFRLRRSRPYAVGRGASAGCAPGRAETLEEECCLRHFKYG